MRSLGDLPWALIGAAYAVASAVTFVVYAIDKRRARRAEWRVPEATLQTLALLGGFPGAYAARRAFRHKTRKVGFSWTLHAIAALHLAAWVAWFAI